MAWSRVQGRGAHHSGTATTQALAYASNVVAGNLLLAAAVWNSAAGSATVTDSQGNTWTAISGSLVNGANATVSIQWFWTVAGSSAANTVTSHLPSTPNQELFLVELSGVDTTTPVDVTGTEDVGSGTPTVTFTTAAADEAILLCCVDINGPVTATGYTNIASVGGLGQLDQKNDPTSAGSVSVVTGHTTNAAAISAIAIKLASGATTTLDASGGTASGDGGTSTLTVTAAASGGAASADGGDSTASAEGAPVTLDASDGAASADGGTAGLRVRARAGDQPLVMPLLSRGLPTDDSSGSSGGNAPANAVDATHATYWASGTHPTTGTPQWLSIDLRGAAGTWSKVLLAFRNQSRPGYQPGATLGTDASSTFQHLIRDYTIDAHASSGSEPAESDAGWVTLVTVTDNERSDPVHTDLDLSSYNWLRVHVTDASGASGNDDARFELELHDHTDGIEDSFITYGDSISMEAFNDPQVDGSVYANGPLSAQIEAATGRVPIFQDISTGGWLSSTGDTNKVDYLGPLPGKYVILAFGANDAEINGVDYVAEGGTTGTHALAYKASMQSIIDYAAGLGKVCIIPRVSYATINGATSEGNTGVIADCVDELVAANPDTVIAGPDLYAWFQSNTNQLRDGLHPTYDQTVPAGLVDGLTGYEQYLRLWSESLVASLYTNPNAAVADGGTATFDSTAPTVVDASGGTASGGGGTSAATVTLAASGGAATASGGTSAPSAGLPASGGTASAAGGTSAPSATLAASDGAASAHGGSATLGGATPPPAEDRPTFVELLTHTAGLALITHEADLELSSHEAGMALVSEHDTFAELVSEHDALLALAAREGDLALGAREATLLLDG